jgi:aryl-alcohol dehydrogenase-like predicted oxidoreductase
VRQIELVPRIYSSQLGFGCAPILGSVDATTAKAAIHFALDQGINHFDLARSYGYGEAEAFVGRILKSKRDSVRIATKFGIRANWKAAILRPVKPIVRMLRPSRRVSSTDFTIPRTSFSEKLLTRVPIDCRNLTQSLHASLRALRTDYVDFLFIHDAIESLRDVELLLDQAHKLKNAGKIRAFGFACTDLASHIHDPYRARFDILQYSNSPHSKHYVRWVSERSQLPNVFFSPLQDRQGDSVSATLKKIAFDFPNSVVLTSMFSKDHIKANCIALED